MTRWTAVVVGLAGLCGCSVTVAKLDVAAPTRFAPEALDTATSLGWGEGSSCRLWVFGIPSGLPQIDEALADALRPANGLFMRRVTVFSEHPVYVIYGWHCYRVQGEVFGAHSTSGNALPPFANRKRHGATFRPFG